MHNLYSFKPYLGDLLGMYCRNIISTSPGIILSSMTSSATRDEISWKLVRTRSYNWLILWSLSSWSAFSFSAKWTYFNIDISYRSIVIRALPNLLYIIFWWMQINTWQWNKSHCYNNRKKSFQFLVLKYFSTGLIFSSFAFLVFVTPDLQIYLFRLKHVNNLMDNK